MRRYRLIAVLTVIVPIVNTPITTTIYAMQSNENPLLNLEELAATQTKAFVITVIWGIIVALVSAGLGIWLYRASNAYQAALTADANSRIAAARTQAEQADKRSDQIEERQRPRIIHSDQQQRFRLAIEAQRRIPITVAYLNGHPEAYDLAVSLGRLLAEAEFRVEVVQRVYTDNPPTNIRITSKDGLENPLCAKLEAAINEMNIIAKCRSHPMFADGRIDIEIGPKESFNSN